MKKNGMQGVHAMKTYDITVTREGKWWMIDVPAIDGLTQARRLSEIKAMAVSLIAVTLDLPASQVGVNVVAMIVDGTNLVEGRRQIDAEREVAGDAERRVASLTMDLVRKLDADHVPLRDIGEAVGVSFQRVHQRSTPNLAGDVFGQMRADAIRAGLEKSTTRWRSSLTCLTRDAFGHVPAYCTAS